MTEREKFEVQEMRQAVFERDGYECCWCGESIFRFGAQQVAHGISQSKNNIKKYGAKVVHSVYNLKSACCLACNNALAVGKANEENRALEIIKLLEDE